MIEAGFAGVRGVIVPIQKGANAVAGYAVQAFHVRMAWLALSGDKFGLSRFGDKFGGDLCLYGILCLYCP